MILNRMGLGGLNETISKYLNELNSVPNLRSKLVPEREDWYFISGAGKYCARRQVLSKLFPGVKDDFSPDGRLAADAGTLLHRQYQTYFGKSGILYGNWVCSNCSALVEGFYPKEVCPCKNSCISACIWPGGFNAPTRACYHCPKAPNFEFKETKILIHDLELVGSYDGFLIEESPDGRFGYILEIKTTKSKSFDWLNSPREDHYLQTQVYLHYEREKLKKLHNLDEVFAIIFYVDRGGVNQSVEFLIEYDRVVVRDFLNKVKFGLESRRTMTLPERTECTKAGTGLSRYCPFTNFCFDPGVDRIYGRQSEPGKETETEIKTEE